MSEELNLLPCPRCGKNVTAKLDRMNEYYVFCCETTADSIEAWNDLPRALTWTTEPPKVCGEYWCEWTNSDGTITTDVIHVRPNMFNWRKQDNRRWAGPIPAPLEPQNG